MQVHHTIRSTFGSGASRGARFAVAMLAAFILVAAYAAAATAAPVLDINTSANSTVAPGGTLEYYVTVHNIGIETTPDLDLDGLADQPHTLTVTLPPGLTALSSSVAQQGSTTWDCSSLVVGDSTITCTNDTVTDPRVNSLRRIKVRIRAAVDPGASGVLTSQFDVTGGEAAPVSTVDPTLVTSVPPEFGIDGFDGQTTANAAGDPYTRAGGHPYGISTAVFFNTITNPIPNKGSTWPVEPVKDVLVDLPPGLVGDPNATSGVRCTQPQLANSESTDSRPLCPSGSQVGVTSIFTADGLVLGNPIPVFNVVAPPNVAARFGFNVGGSVVLLDASVRTGGSYGVSVNVRNIPEGIAAAGTLLTFWGVPADPSHNAQRACPGQSGPAAGGPICTTDLPLKAFLRNPTSCGAPGETTARIDSWTDPGDFKTASFLTHDPPAFPTPAGSRGPANSITDCATVPFEPTFSASPRDATAGSPSGFTFDLTLPQTSNPDQRGTSDLKKAVVTLPVGLRVSPSSAAGLGACAPAQIDLNSAADAACPNSSKIGTVVVTTPLLDEPLTGAVYLAKPHDNPFNTLLSLYVVAKGPGVVVKLPGRVETDPITGQMTATFDDNPQLPFSNLHLEFKGGPRAPLVNPASCGTYATHAVLTSWSGSTVVSDSTFAISKDGNGTPCAASQFSPDFEAGASSVEAGKNTTFDLRLSRSDDDQELKTLDVTMPNGLLAKVAGVPLCNADVEGKAGTCSEASRIGDILTGSGAGPNPFYLPGRVYLTGPYNDGPFGLSIVVPAVAGPFDLGTVVVRASIRLDRRTSQLSVVSDPFPTILEGITLQVRDVRVSVNRSKFMVNPTGCGQKQIRGTVKSTGGLTANVSSRFQVGGCKKLPLRPRMVLSVGSKGHTGAGSSTPLTARLTQTPGQSNLKTVDVTLPLSLNALLPVVTNSCTQAEFDANDCEKARTGSAVAVTPLLDKPLKGSVYFVKDPKAPRGALPNLVVALRGQVDFDLVGKIILPGGVRLETAFRAVPDVPITSFTLKMSTGKHGAVGVAENLCTKKSKRATARVVFTGQNGRVVRSNQRLKIHGCSARK